MQLTLIEIIGLMGGTSGLTAFIQYLLTANIQRKKENALAIQEQQKGVQERANSVEKTQEIYDKLTERVNKELEDVYKKISELEKLVDLYKKKCSNCANNRL